MRIRLTHSIRPISRAAPLALGFALTVTFAGTASAQNLFEALFGASRAAPQTQARAVGGGTAFCVRTCDGRFFPLQRHPKVAPVELCQTFCPATETQVFFGGSIDQAVARNGTRYGDLANAFLFRQRLVAGCTCNGKDSVGLAAVDIADDHTLRPGDIVATASGYVAYDVTQSRRGHMAGNFTPVKINSGLSRAVRR